MQNPYVSPPMSRENTPRTSSSDDHGSPSLVNNNLVSFNPTSGSTAANLSVSPRHTNDGIINSMASSTTVKILRLGVLGPFFTQPGQSDTAGFLLRALHLANSSTSTSYKRGQVLFVKWAISHNDPITTFTETHLIDFLAETLEIRDYHGSTIYLFRSAVTHLHQSLTSLRASETMNALIKSLRHHPNRFIDQTSTLGRPFKNYAELI